MTGCINGQTDERAVGGAIGPGKPGLERVLGLAQRRSGPQFEDARRYSRQNAWILPPRGITLAREESGGVAGRSHMGNVGLELKYFLVISIRLSLMLNQGQVWSVENLGDEA